MIVTWVLRAFLREEVEPAVPLPAGVSIRKGRLIPAIAGRLAGMGGPAAAVTLGRTIVLQPAVRPTERLLRHELAHVRQWSERPVAFPLLYVLRHLRFGYTDNPYEVEARAEEQDRTGLAG